MFCKYNNDKNKALNELNKIASDLQELKEKNRAITKIQIHSLITCEECGKHIAFNKVFKP